MPTSATGKGSARLRGFSLIELLVVLALLGVLAGMIVPRMGRSLERVEVREAAARFAHTARTVRQLAIASREPWAIELDLDARAYAVTRGGERGAQGAGQMVRASWLKADRWPDCVESVRFRGMRGETAMGGTARVSFGPDGISSGGTIGLAHRNGTCGIVVQPHSGRVEVVEDRDALVTSDQLDLGD